MLGATVVQATYKSYLDYMKKDESVLMRNVYSARTSLHSERVDSPSHQHQFVPLCQAMRNGTVVKFHVGKTDMPLLQLQVVYHQTAIFCMQDFYVHIPEHTRSIFRGCSQQPEGLKRPHFDVR